MTKRHRPCRRRSCGKRDPGLVSGPGWVAAPGRREPESQKALCSESPMERSVRSTMDRVPPRPSCSSKLSLPLECSILVWRVLRWERKLLLSR